MNIHCTLLAIVLSLVGISHALAAPPTGNVQVVMPNNATLPVTLFGENYQTYEVGPGQFDLKVPDGICILVHYSYGPHGSQQGEDTGPRYVNPGGSTDPTIVSGGTHAVTIPKGGNWLIRFRLTDC